MKLSYSIILFCAPSGTKEIAWLTPTAQLWPSSQSAASTWSSWAFTPAPQRRWRHRRRSGVLKRWATKSQTPKCVALSDSATKASPRARHQRLQLSPRPLMITCQDCRSTQRARSAVRPNLPERQTSSPSTQWRRPWLDFFVSCTTLLPARRIPSRHARISRLDYLNKQHFVVDLR